MLVEGDQFLSQPCVSAADGSRPKVFRSDNILPKEKSCLPEISHGVPTEVNQFTGFVAEVPHHIGKEGPWLQVFKVGDSIEEYGGIEFLVAAHV